MVGFLDLPREVRDEIYIINLVHGTIPIGTSEKFLHTSYGQISQVEPEERMTSWGSSYRTSCYCESCTDTGLRVQPILLRNTKRSVRDLYATFGTIKNTAGTPISKIQESYGQPEVTHSGFAVGFRQQLIIFDSRNLSIFLANRKIYQEASAIFYSRNKFDFGCRYHGYDDYSHSLENALDFLQDRSKHALAHLKSIRLALGKQSKDKLFEESWYRGPQLQVLCEILANESQLSELSVGIFGTHYGSSPHPCLEQLSKIKGLRDLHIWIEGRDEDYGVLESSLATIKAFRCQSLIGGDKMGEDGFDISRRGMMMIRVSTWKTEGEYDEF